MNSLFLFLSLIAHLVIRSIVHLACAKIARYLPENPVENYEQKSDLCTTEISNYLDEKNYPFLGTNGQQLIHRVIRSIKPVFTGPAAVNNKLLTA
jgi:hypothetical protein